MYTVDKRSMQQYVGAHVWRLNKKLADNGSKLRIVIGTARDTYKLSNAE